MNVAIVTHLIHALIPWWLATDPLTGDPLTALESLLLLLSYTVPFLAVGALAVTTWLYAQRLGRSHVVARLAKVAPPTNVVPIHVRRQQLQRAVVLGDSKGAA